MQTRLACLLVVSAALSACGGGKLTRDGAPSGSVRIPDLPDDAVPRPEPRSKYGNGPVYEVLGKRYSVMPSSTGYQERGVASWYGTKFHGNLTSSREPYDMYSMTAAHKTLPLPTYVRVRNLSNNKSVVVRVNDRGPFVHNRIIDLSYAAALKLDMIRDGTSLVEITAIDFGEPGRDRPVRRSQPAVPAPMPAAEPEPAVSRLYAQVGAFGDRGNAERRLQTLVDAGIRGGFIHEESAASGMLYRVRIGPVVDVLQYDLLVEELESIGIADPYLVND
jgi:rare lipoprotein A